MSKIKKVLIRENGDQVKITAFFKKIPNDSAADFTLRPGYDFTVHIKEKWKKKWEEPFDRDSWEYRDQQFPDGRRAYEMKFCMEHITQEELERVYVELWRSIRPVSTTSYYEKFLS